MTKIYSRSDLMKLAIAEHMACKEFPRVGAVVAKSRQVLSTGHRGEKKGIHAERIAIEKLGKEQLQDSIIYTTLEPCIELKDEQDIKPCSELIIESGIKEAVIGVLDPNGTIYSQGYRKLLENNISVSFFNRRLRAAVEEETFEFGELHRIYGSGRRRIPVVEGGISIEVQFSEKDTRIINIRWATLQPEHGCVDLSSGSGAIRIASGARNFGDISDPTVFRFPNYAVRMRNGMIAIVKPSHSTFCVLIQLIKILKDDIIFQWEVRNEK